MEIGERLRELREAKGLSQGDIEHDAGLLRCYVSRVENGHTAPSIPVLERWAKALGVELYQVFFAGCGRPDAPIVPVAISYGPQERNLLGLFTYLSAEDRALLISLAREMVKRKGKHA